MFISNLLPAVPYETALTAKCDEWSAWCQTSLDTHGIKVEFGRDGTAQASVKCWTLGAVDIIRLRAVNLSLLPVPATLEEYVFVKVVKSGTMSFETKVGMQRFEAGSLVVTDPKARYAQRFGRQTDVISVRVLKRLLIERGFRGNPNGLVIPNIDTSDARAIRDFLLTLELQDGTTSQALRERQAAHLLDLLGVVSADPSALSRISTTDITLSRAKGYIAQHLHDIDLDVKRVASGLGISSSHLSRAFSANNMSVMRYVWSCRLERAADVLTRSHTSAITISEVAYRCGFENASHFSRTFKERFGVSPREATCNGRAVVINELAKQIGK